MAMAAVPAALESHRQKVAPIGPSVSPRGSRPAEDGRSEGRMRGYSSVALSRLSDTNVGIAIDHKGTCTRLLYSCRPIVQGVERRD
jgi:hypothetical protein